MKSGYAPVGEVELYYEVHGTSNPSNPIPLLLLHGGGDTIKTSFGQILPKLSRRRKVVAFERQGYGHTADIEGRPFSFENSADDTAALLKHLGIGKADVLGFSNGGTVALQVAIRHQSLVRKLVVVSALFSRDGADPAFWNGFRAAKLGDMPKELQDAYLEVAPRPENLQRMFDKAVQLMRNFEGVSRDAIRKIKAPALVICGDSDVVRPEHAVEAFRLLPHGQLAILPRTDHTQVMTRTSWLVPMIERFLDEE